MCVICGDPPTWRFTFADYSRLTSAMPRDFAEAQAKAHGIRVILVERFVSGKWRSATDDALKAKRAQDQK